MNPKSLFFKSDHTILDSIHTYQKALMNDMNLTLRLNYNQHTYITHLVEWTDSVVTFDAPMKGTEDLILPNDQFLDVTLVSKVALFSTTFKIKKNYQDEDKLYYVAEITTPLIKKQQRESFRLDVTLDVNYQLLDSKQDTTLSPFIERGTCVNISLGGMCLVCEHQLHSGDIVNLFFMLLDTPLQFMGEVISLGEKLNSAVFSHRIRFIALDTADINHLNRLIFAKQRQQLKHP